jgi:hypothetical protein
MGRVEILTGVERLCACRKRLTGRLLSIFKQLSLRVPINRIHIQAFGVVLLVG